MNELREWNESGDINPKLQKKQVSLPFSQDMQ